MEYTAIASWLNTAFAGFDGAILGFMNSLAIAAGGVITPIAKFITFLGEKGILMFLIALGLMCFSKTRRIGVCMFGAVCCGALITNIILKDMVARPRPFEDMSVFRSYWDLVGSPAEDGFSFPSGHVTAAAAGMAALCFTRGKRMIAPGVIFVVLMGFSRNYLMAHYPSDVLFAIIIGVFSAFVAYLITKAIFNYLEDNDDFPFCATLLYFDLPVQLPDKAALTSFVNHAGKGTGKASGRASAKSARKADAPRAAARRAERVGGHAAKDAQSADGGEGAFSGALRLAMNAGNELLGKAGAKRPEGDSPSRKSASPSDWNSRWESYRTAKDSAKCSSAPAGEFTSRFAAQEYNDAAAARAAEAVAAADDEDADMKIVPERAESRAEFDWSADLLSAAPSDAGEAAGGSAPVSSDGIDWASLGLSELADDSFGFTPEEAAPVKRRSTSRAASASGSYRGRH